MFDEPRAVIAAAVDARAFPAAVTEVGTATAVLWTEAFGRLTTAPDAARTSIDTIFDLASLTKVLATTPIALQLVERGALRLDDHVSEHLVWWRGGLRDTVTIRDLLAHCSGLPAYQPLYRDRIGRAAFEEALAGTPLEYAPRTAAVYSDLGFILLGFLLDTVTGVPLDERFEALARQVDPSARLQFTPPPRWRAEIAPTEQDPWRGRLLVGEVHDENAAALQGVAGHAGLFGTTAAVGAHARHLLQVLSGRAGVVSQASLRAAVTRRPDVPGSSRALGWDTMLPTSSCGTLMSPLSFGHTGFTGTSLWIDPTRGIYAVLLTNRVHPTRENDAIRAVRPAFHDGVIRALGDAAETG